MSASRTEEAAKGRKAAIDCEVLYVAAAPREHLEEYLEALWLLEEKGEAVAKISTISRYLKISQPSVVQMLKKLERQKLVKYRPRKGVQLTPRGREVGRRMVRNGRLIEVLMEEKFNLKADGKVACGIEHHLTEEFADALCTMLNHPRFCPHMGVIPEGKCCQASRARPPGGGSPA